MKTISRRIEELDWSAIERSLEERGYAMTPPLLSSSECKDLIALYDHDKSFRKRVVMERVNFGVGEYKYMAAPLPNLVEELRNSLYRSLAPTANRWANALRAD